MMKPEVKAAWIGALSAILCSLISAGIAIYALHDNQEPEDPPVVIKEPYVVKEREIIREYIPVNHDHKGEATTSPPTRTEIDTTIVPVESEDQQDLSQLDDVLYNKQIGIYYSRKDKHAKSKAASLSARLSDAGYDAVYYSIGGRFFSPETPNANYFYGINRFNEDLIREFKDSFRFTGTVVPFDQPLTKQPKLGNDIWKLDLSIEKDIYIIIGS